MKTYRDLEVWQEAMQLAEAAYKVAITYPKESTWGLKQQTQRAALSVPANIAEGHARGYRKEFYHFTAIARGSLAELETHIILAHRLGYLSQENLDDLWKKAKTVGRLLNGLLRSLRQENP